MTTITQNNICNTTDLCTTAEVGLMFNFLLVQIIVDCSGEGVQEKTMDTAFLNKKAALLKLAEENRVPRTIVFCNKVF